MVFFSTCFLISTFWLLQILLLSWIFTYKSLCGRIFSFLLGRYLGMDLLDRMVNVLLLKNTSNCHTSIFISKLGSRGLEHGRRSPKTGSQLSALSAGSTSLLKVIDSHIKSLPLKITQSAGGIRADRQLWKKESILQYKASPSPTNCLGRDQEIQEKKRTW